MKPTKMKSRRWARTRWTVLWLLTAAAPLSFSMPAEEPLNPDANEPPGPTAEDPGNTSPKDALKGSPEKDLQDLSEQRRVVRKFYAGLQSPDLAKVQEAADQLVATKSPHGASYLWELYGRSFAQRREIALTALGKLRVTGQQDQIFQESLRESLLALRRLGSEVLAKWIGKNAALQMYFEILETPQKYVSADSLKGSVPETNALISLLRFRAVQLIAHLGGAGVADRLVKYLDDPDTEVAVATAEGLGLLGEIQVIPAMIAKLKTPNPELGPALAEAMEQLTKSGHRFDLVKWEQWQEDFKSGLIKAKVPDSERSFEEEQKRYEPDYQDPYLQPLEKSAVDLVIVHDTTGSLGRIWLRVAARLDAVIGEMIQKTPSLRLGVVRYRGDDPRQSLNYIIKPKPITRKVKEAQEFIREASFGGGSGGWSIGLHHAISSFKWRVNARKVVVIMGDTTPQENKLAACYQLVQDAWQYDRIQTNSLLIPTAYHPGDHQKSYGSMARYGAGRFYTYLRDWDHLIDLTPQLLDPKATIEKANTELPSATIHRWLNPVNYKREIDGKE